jgi:hypothetical protein
MSRFTKFAVASLALVAGSVLVASDAQAGVIGRTLVRSAVRPGPGVVVRTPGILTPNVVVKPAPILRPVIGPAPILRRVIR